MFVIAAEQYRRMSLSPMGLVHFKRYRGRVVLAESLSPDKSLRFNQRIPVLRARTTSVDEPFPNASREKCSLLRPNNIDG
jgi:hypothetical protein